MNTLTPGALTVLEKRYLKRDETGRVVETPDGLFRRVAANVASAEAIYGGSAALYEEEFHSLMSSLEFLPNSPTLMNAGRRLQQLAACFVLPVGDSLESIFEAVKNTAIIHQSGGGTGFSFSRLRPSNAIVGSTGALASGPVSFMRVFNAATEAIKQGGARRGANMGVLRVDHPDIASFITVKRDPAELRNFNLSVAVTDAFMDALAKDADYALIDPRTGAEAGKKSAKEVFGLIVEAAWAGGEPGVLFIDRINRANPTPQLGQIEATNPCGEQPLLAYEPCNLGSVNLSRMLKREGRPARWRIDYAKLERTVSLGLRFLDDVIDMSRYPVGEIEVMAKANRKVGLGVMGFADMLARMRLPYGGAESLALAEELMRFISGAAWEESLRLAEARGPFPNIKGSVFDKPGTAPVRNATVTTIAPTGTLSIIAGCSSGIEPIYSLSYTRRILNGAEIPEVNPILVEVAGEEGNSPPDFIEFIASGGDIKSRDDVPEEIKKVFVTAFDLPPEAHVRMQAAFQKYTDNAVSKTINMASDASIEAAAAAYLLAYELGCKGITVYRSGTRTGQALSCKSTLYC
ncbi:MAG: adenosylcobalamin-dependent ribonucleoside-diphosphate reductase [Deltaproteobacteria bacterium]|nr:adenosylcobalamin-dependent ribonucleoside-diphosphate reductase [Deltaproteobacteria bacterium]